MTVCFYLWASKKSSSFLLDFQASSLLWSQLLLFLDSELVYFFVIVGVEMIFMVVVFISAIWDMAIIESSRELASAIEGFLEYHLQHVSL